MATREKQLIPGLLNQKEKLQQAASHAVLGDLGGIEGASFR
jgi:hypothetical protein